jgi:3-hydroxy-9,10-secoandrosta-1,3,5(10)-triene-9,17-dione monooxygenase
MLTADHPTVPEPDLTEEEMVERARALHDVIRAEAEAAEAAGGYSAELHRRFVDAGFFRIVQPRRYGGYGFSVETFFRVIMAVSEAHTATGWNLSLGSAHTLQVCAYFSEEAQDEIFAGSGYFSAPHRAAPVGRATPVDGGYRIDGRWEYASGITHASHFIATSIGPAPGGGPDVVLAPLVPIDRVTVLGDWGGEQSLGLRASGSNTVLVDGVFVPSHLVEPYDWAEVELAPEGPKGYRVHGDPMYLGRTLTIYYGELASLLVGAGRSSVAEYERLMRERGTSFPPVVPRMESDHHLRWLGHARRRVEAAEALVIMAARGHRERGERWASHGEPFTPADDDHLRGLLTQAGTLATEAVELLFKTAGSRAIRPGSILQRNFRDVATAATHPAANYDAVAEMSSRMRLGLPVPAVF